MQGFTHRLTHFRMQIFFSLYCNSFAYIEEKGWKLYIHPNWKHLSTLDSKPFCLGRLPPCICIITHDRVFCRLFSIVVSWWEREKGRDLTQPYDKQPWTTDNAWVKWHKDATNTFDYTTITDRLSTVSRTTVIQPMWLTWGLRDQPSHFPQSPCNQKDKH